MPPAAADLNALLPASSLIVELLVSDDQILVLSARRGDAEPDVRAALIPIKRRDLARKIASALEPPVVQDAALWSSRSASLAEI